MKDLELADYFKIAVIIMGLFCSGFIVGVYVSKQQMLNAECKHNFPQQQIYRVK